MEAGRENSNFYSVGWPWEGNTFYHNHFSFKTSWFQQTLSYCPYRKLSLIGRKVMILIDISLNILVSMCTCVYIYKYIPGVFLQDLQLFCPCFFLFLFWTAHLCWARHIFLLPLFAFVTSLCRRSPSQTAGEGDTECRLPATGHFHFTPAKPQPTHHSFTPSQGWNH